MGELNKVQSEIITADLLFATIMHDYDYNALGDSKADDHTSWSGPRSDAIPSVLLVRGFGALDQANFDFSKILSLGKLPTPTTGLARMGSEEGRRAIDCVRSDAP